MMYYVINAYVLQPFWPCTYGVPLVTFLSVLFVVSVSVHFTFNTHHHFLSVTHSVSSGISFILCASPSMAHYILYHHNANLSITT